MKRAQLRSGHRSRALTTTIFGAIVMAAHSLSPNVKQCDGLSSGKLQRVRNPDPHRARRAERVKLGYPKNLTDHFLGEWFWRPAAIVSYSGGRLSGARAATAWHGTLSEMGMVVTSSTIAVGPIGQALSAEGEPIGEGGQALERGFPRFADDLMWWVESAKTQRQHKRPPD